MNLSETPKIDLSNYFRLLMARMRIIRRNIRLSYFGSLILYMGLSGWLINLLLDRLLTFSIFSILELSIFCFGLLSIHLFVSKKYTVLSIGKDLGNKQSVLEIWGNQKRNFLNAIRDHRLFDLLAVHTTIEDHKESDHVLKCSTCELLLSAMSHEFKTNHALTTTFQFLEQTEAVSMTELLTKLNESISGEESGFIDPENAETLTNELVNNDCPVETVLKTLDIALIRIGNMFESREIYYPQVLQTALAVKNSLKVIDDAYPSYTKPKQAGCILLGVVKGDIHDIGKNIVKMFLEFNGYNVVDLGVDLSPNEFIEAVSKYSPDLIGVSAFINTVIPTLKETIHSLRQTGFDKPILAGGIAVNELTVNKIKKELDNTNFESQGDLIYAHNVQGVLKEVNKIFQPENYLELVA